MTTKPIVRLISGVALVGVLVTGALLIPAEKAPAKNGPGVARVSVVEGSTIVQRGDSHTQTNAVRNAPLLPGDYVSTRKTSRAELQFDGYTAVRFGGNVQARITSNDPDNRRMQLADGTVEIGLVHDGQMMQIDTPSVTVRARQAGDYRISIAPDGSSWITARRGSVDVVTPQRTYTLDTGRTLVARGSAALPAITYASEVALDSFDDFNVQRDKTMVAAQNASPNLNPGVAGYDNLAAYGKWQAVAGYGQSWVPNEPAGWAPYRNGSWAWEDGYGWTWIGSEPWGWAPYHYGNWYYCDCGPSGWAWLPPAYAATPDWSPALVGFFGFDAGVAGAGGPGYNNCGGNYGYGPEGSGYAGAPSGNNAPVGTPGTSYSSGAPAPYGEGGPGNYGYPASTSPYNYSYPYIGWVPVAPYEPFYAWYPGWAWLGYGWGVSLFGGYGYPGFATSITNITRITNINRIYRNFRHGGATATAIRNFRHGTVSGHTVAVTTRDIGRRFGTIHGALPVAPTRANLAFSHSRVHAPVTFSKTFNSPRFASDRALAARTSFAHQQKEVAQAIRGGLTGHATAQAAVRHGNAPVSRVNAPPSRMNAAMTHANVPETHANAFQTRGNPPVTHENTAPSRRIEAARRENAPVARENAAPSRQIEATHSENAPVSRENAAPVTRANRAPAIRGESSATTRENSEMRGENSEMHEGSAASRQVETTRDFAPSTSWGRFNDARGEARSAGIPAGSERATSATDTREGQVPAPSEGRREGRGPTDSWGRFSDSRGQSYESARNPYAERESTPSYSRGSYPSYSRGSYPSYSRGSYPSYSRGSYPSYSRGSYPSYSRGSYGPGPSYSRGNFAPSRPSGGGGGGDRHGGGGRPPQ
jgi:hypothetical protein